MVLVEVDGQSKETGVSRHDESCDAESWEESELGEGKLTREDMEGL